MERYWCLRWIEQERVKALEATAQRRENFVRLDRLPIVLRVASAPALKPGERIRLGVESLDLLTLQLDCRYIDSVGEADGPDDAAGDGFSGEAEEAEELD
jgi:exoribonuclease-2